jgi:hypothetical protein
VPGLIQDHQDLHCREDLLVVIWAKLDRLVLTPPPKEDAENKHVDRGVAARAKVNLFREGEIPDVCLSEYVLIGNSNDRPVRHGGLKTSLGVVRFGKKPSSRSPRPLADPLAQVPKPSLVETARCTCEAFPGFPD